MSAFSPITPMMPVARSCWNDPRMRPAFEIWTRVDRAARAGGNRAGELVEHFGRLLIGQGVEKLGAAHSWRGGHHGRGVALADLRDLQHLLDRCDACHRLLRKLPRVCESADHLAVE